MTPLDLQLLQSSYDRVAEEYTTRIAGELMHKPFDRHILNQFAERVKLLGAACDLGCGPGHIARYLHDQGLPMMGLDLSPALIEIARSRNPEIEFQQGDMRSLPFASESLGGVVAFYSLIHISRTDLIATLREIHRVLQPGGLLLLAYHIGDGQFHLEQWWGHDVSVKFEFFRPSEMIDKLLEAGFELLESQVREPYPDVEHPSQRAYQLASKPGT